MEINKNTDTLSSVEDIDVSERVNAIKSKLNTVKTNIKQKEDMNTTKLYMINNMLFIILAIIILSGFFVITQRIDQKEKVEVNVDIKPFMEQVEKINSTMVSSNKTLVEDLGEIQEGIKIIAERPVYIPSVKSNYTSKVVRYRNNAHVSKVFKRNPSSIEKEFKKKTWNPVINKDTSSKHMLKLEDPNSDIRESTFEHDSEHTHTIVSPVPVKEVKIYSDKELKEKAFGSKSSELNTIVKTPNKPVMVDPAPGFKLIGKSKNGDEIYYNETTGARYEKIHK